MEFDDDLRDDFLAGKMEFDVFLEKDGPEFMENYFLCRSNLWFLNWGHPELQVPTNMAPNGIDLWASKTATALTLCSSPVLVLRGHERVENFLTSLVLHKHAHYQAMEIRMMEFIDEYGPSIDNMLTTHSPLNPLIEFWLLSGEY